MFSDYVIKLRNICLIYIVWMWIFISSSRIAFGHS